MTDDQDRKKGELINFMTAAARRGKKIEKTAPSVSIKGDGNIVGNHNIVKVTVNTKPATKVVATPGDAHISQAQAREISELVRRIVETSTKANTTFQKVWSTLKRKFRFSTYHFIPAGQYSEIHAYLVAWLASNGASKPASSNAGGDRKRLLARIHVEAKKRPGGIERFKQDNGVESLSALSDDQLRALASKLKP